MNNKEKTGNYDCFRYTHCALCGWEYDISVYAPYRCPCCGASMATTMGWDLQRNVIAKRNDVS